MADVESDDPTRKRRFADIGDEDIDLLLKKKDSLSTKQATRTSVKVLRDFQEQLHSADGEADRDSESESETDQFEWFDKLSNADLDALLRKFWPNVRKSSHVFWLYLCDKRLFEKLH